MVLRGGTVGVFCGGKHFAVICAAWLLAVVGVVESRVRPPSFHHIILDFWWERAELIPPLQRQYSGQCGQ